MSAFVGIVTGRLILANDAQFLYVFVRIYIKIQVGSFNKEMCMDLSSTIIDKYIISIV